MDENLKMVELSQARPRKFEFKRREPTGPKPEETLLVSGDKAVDMAALTQRIRVKGSGPFKKALTEVFAEMEPGHENGVLLTHAQVARMFDVTSATIYDWRKRFALPAVVLKGGRKPPVRYDEGAMKAWGELHGKRVMKDDYHDWV